MCVCSVSSPCTPGLAVEQEGWSVDMARSVGGVFGREAECLGEGEGGEEVGLVTRGEGSSKHEENNSNVDPIIFRPSLRRGRVAKGLGTAPFTLGGAV